MWNYIFYIAYLKSKVKTEYSGFESYVNEKLENYDITWFPLNRALSHSGKNDENKKEMDEESDEKEGGIKEEDLHKEKEIISNLEEFDKELDNLEINLKNKIREDSSQ